MAKTKNVLERVYVSILLIIFGGIIFHAPLSVGLGVLMPDYDLLIKSWKEILMLIAGVLVLVILAQRRQYGLLKRPLMLLIAAYAVLHIITAFIANKGLNSTLAGLAIDLRYVLYFGLVYLALTLYPAWRKVFIKVGVIGAIIVVVFGLLQVFVLPNDVLKYIGYSTDTISAYLTVDLNEQFIRINSTLRGPNPLGAYAAVVVVVVAAYVLQYKNKLKNRSKWLFGLLAAGSLIVLWHSYSRSAVLALMIGLAVIVVAYWHKGLSKQILSPKWLLAFVGILLIGGLSMLSQPHLVSNIVYHENPTEGNDVNSNDGHIDSLETGINLMLKQPMGAGVGSTGSASLYGEKPLIIENQYLFTAHESGWLGLIIFSGIFYIIMANLWRARADYLALGLFAGGVGLAVIGLVLPVWADDTVAIMWWGFAGVVFASLNKVKYEK